MLAKMEYWNNGIKKQKDQFHCLGIISNPFFQYSNLPTFRNLKNIINRFSNQSFPKIMSKNQNPDFGQQTSDFSKVRITSIFHFGNSSKESSL